jgi:glycosyltransferase involved in cell wall biosynthesis
VRIGIVIPAHNAAPWIADAIVSVLAQGFQDWTLLVVDDGSTDATAELVSYFTDPRIPLETQQKSGVSVARNRGCRALDADALLFLDADDWLGEDALSRLAEALASRPDAVAASGSCGFVSENAMIGEPPRRKLPPAGGDLLERLVERNLFANGGHVLLRADAARAVGGFRPGLAYGEDWEFFIRTALRGPFAVAREPGRPTLLIRRRHAGTYLRLAADPAFFAPCMEAIFSNPDLRARLGPRLPALRARTEAENEWVIGRALLAQGLRREGLARLRRSVAAKPSLKRLAVLAGAPLLRGG